MDLNDAQKTMIKQWLDEGENIAGIQKKLASELGITMTYMDVRLIMVDLNLSIKEPVEEVKTVPEDTEASKQTAESDQVAFGGLSVEVDRIMTPGSIVSGSVCFSDGVNATWAVDRSGRLALDAGDANYTPSEDDLKNFQQALKAAIEKQGF